MEVLVVVEVGIRLREIQALPSQDKDIPEAAPTSGAWRTNGWSVFQNLLGRTCHIFVTKYLYRTLTYFCSCLYQSPSIYFIYVYDDFS